MERERGGCYGNSSACPTLPFTCNRGGSMGQQKGPVDGGGGGLIMVYQCKWLKASYSAE